MIEDRNMINESNLTPMMQQYLQTKALYPDCILFFRLGDFYEMFFEDAVNVSKLLNLALTSRSRGEDKVPMCGVPHHSAKFYINKLLDMGYKIAICDQVEDPRFAKGIVKREVTRIVTPGMVLDTDTLESDRFNFICSIYEEKNRFSLAFLDPSTGDLFIFSTEDGEELISRIKLMEPREILLYEGSKNGEVVKILEKERVRYSVLERTYFENESHIGNFNISDTFILKSVYAIINYVRSLQKRDIALIKEPMRLDEEQFLYLDETCQRNLEIFENTLDKKKFGSLFWAVDRTNSAMGSRMLRRWLQYPLLKIEEIKKRYYAVEELRSDTLRLKELSELIRGISDIERVASKICYRHANPKDLISLKNSIKPIEKIKKIISQFKSELITEINQKIDTLSDIYELIEKRIVDEPPSAINEGGIIKAGNNDELDELIRISKDLKSIIAGIEERERARTQITSLKVRYNKVFGYFIEVTKPNLHLVPRDYIRKQTMVNAERFITEELKSLEEKVLSSDERRKALEYDIFMNTLSDISLNTPRIEKTAEGIAELDVLLSFATISLEENFVKPELTEENIIDLYGARHPVLSKLIGYNRYVPNDLHLSTEDTQIMIVTGPNMAGKSTLMRMTAQIVILAQAGCFVPATSARIGIVDRIFTRVGASDFLSRGLSTFMVEMVEVGTILKKATERSLILLDEVGRGTSTFDGISIAWAIAEDIHDRIGARTIFATHYHELTDLSLTKPRIKNFSVSVKEFNNEIIFLYKLVPGGTSLSYGIQVAKLAGIPEGVIKRAQEILKNLMETEFDDIGRPRLSRSEKRVESAQLSLFHSNVENEILDEIEGLEINQITPIDALNFLFKIKERLKKK
ncbi:MAG: DNA mismatch repair protein MutS [Myxococcota bacterium]